MPAEQSRRGDDEARPPLLGKDARCGREEELVEALELGARGLALQDLYLVAKDQDLRLTVSRLTRRSQSEDEAENHIQEGEQHRRILETVRRRMHRVLVPLRVFSSRRLSGARAHGSDDRGAHTR